MAKPDPNYAERAQNCEQERAALRLQVERLTGERNDAGLGAYVKRVNEYETMLKKANEEVTLYRTRAVAAEEQANAWMRRALNAEREAAFARDKLKAVNALVADKACLIPQLQEMTREFS